MPEGVNELNLVIENLEKKKTDNNTKWFSFIIIYITFT